MLPLPGAATLYRMAQDRGHLSNEDWADTSMGESQWIANMKANHGGGWRRIIHNKLIASMTLQSEHQSKHIDGCMDPAALNYMSQATKNCCCNYPAVPGCMYPTATNYNSDATVDDGSCTYASAPPPPPPPPPDAPPVEPPVVPPVVPPVGGPAPEPKLDEEKPFMEKYKYPLIAVGVVLLAFMFMKDKPQAQATAPIIIK